MTYTREELMKLNRLTLLEISSAAGLPAEIMKEDYEDIVQKLLDSEVEILTQQQIDQSPLLRLMTTVGERKIREAERQESDG